MLELKKERYIDVKFESSSVIYTYICPEDLDCSIGDKLTIISNGKVENVEVIKEPYSSMTKTDRKYVLLELYKKDDVVKELDNKLKNQRSPQDQWNMYIKYGIEPDDDFFW